MPLQSNFWTADDRSLVERNLEAVRRDRASPDGLLGVIGLLTLASGALAITASQLARAARKGAAVDPDRLAGLNTMIADCRWLLAEATGSDPCKE